MNKKDYILFDLDGTLTDPKEGITKAVSYALAYYGIEVEDRDSLCPFIGPPLVQSFMDFYGFDRAKAKEAVVKYREYYEEKGLYENYIYDGIARLLQELKERGKKIILATSKPTVYAEKILDMFDIKEYFAFISGSELNGERGEKWEVIAYALDKCEIADISQAVMIGDRKFDMLGAGKFSIDAIGVLYGYGAAEELLESGAARIVESVKELSEALLGER